MSRVVWTRQSILDVEAIRNYIARDSPRYATVVGDQIVTVPWEVREVRRAS